MTIAKAPARYGAMEGACAGGFATAVGDVTENQISKNDLTEIAALKYHCVSCNTPKCSGAYGSVTELPDRTPGQK